MYPIIVVENCPDFSQDVPTEVIKEWDDKGEIKIIEVVQYDPEWENLNHLFDKLPEKGNVLTLEGVLGD